MVVTASVFANVGSDAICKASSSPSFSTWLSNTQRDPDAADAEATAPAAADVAVSEVTVAQLCSSFFSVPGTTTAPPHVVVVTIAVNFRP